MGQGLSPTVLIVEDDQSCGELIAEVVQDLGFFARMHDRVEQTLALIRQERPALVVLDKMLPDTAVVAKPFHIEAFGQMIMELVAVSSDPSPISQHP